MGYILNFAAELEADLEALWPTAPEDAALWDDLLDLLWNNSRLCDQLTRHNGYNAMQPRFDIVPVGAYLRLGLNVNRLKLYKVAGQPMPQRLLFSVHHRAVDSGTIHLLGLMPRHYEYDPNDAFGSRIIDQYDRLGVPRVPRG